MKTLGEESITADQLAKKAKVSFPGEIIEEILSRLPVKSVSKPWLSCISDPSFRKLHSTRTHRTALFMTAYDASTCERYFFSAAHDGGPLTHLMTVSNTGCFVEAEHLNGLVCFICNSRHGVFIANPSTHKIFKVPKPYTNGKGPSVYFFGFDESTNEFKILTFSYPIRSEVMIFCMSTYSWRKINVELPVGCSWRNLWTNQNSVCVNSVVHSVLQDSFNILAFDLRTEKFSIINTPLGVLNDKVDVYRIKRIF